jgi:hypothetical protein
MKPVPKTLQKRGLRNPITAVLLSPKIDVPKPLIFGTLFSVGDGSTMPCRPFWPVDAGLSAGATVGCHFINLLSR